MKYANVSFPSLKKLSEKKSNIIYQFNKQNVSLVNFLNHILNNITTLIKNNEEILCKSNEKCEKIKENEEKSREKSCEIEGTDVRNFEKSTQICVKSPNNSKREERNVQNNIQNTNVNILITQTNFQNNSNNNQIKDKETASLQSLSFLQSRLSALNSTLQNSQNKLQNVKKVHAKLQRFLQSSSNDSFKPPKSPLKFPKTSSPLSLEILRLRSENLDLSLQISALKSEQKEAEKRKISLENEERSEKEIGRKAEEVKFLIKSKNDWFLKLASGKKGVAGLVAEFGKVKEMYKRWKGEREGRERKDEEDLGEKERVKKIASFISLLSSELKGNTTEIISRINSDQSKMLSD